MKPAAQDLEVWLDCDLYPVQRIGTLFHDRGQVRFQYDAAWLRQGNTAIAIDPDLTLDRGAFFPKPEAGNFGIFLDSSPDRWGQTLMRRREALQAKDEGRAARTLYAWDFLLGVQDITRQGALRFKFTNAPTFLASEALGAPPVTNLGELAAIATELTRKDINDLDQLRQWLAVLVAPGASLGGARPKANFAESDGSLWIAKFPSSDDDRDVGNWEWLTWFLAQKAGIMVPEAKRVRLGKTGYHTFCAKRFDRIGGERRFYASAMTLLKKDVSEGTSYLELAEFIARQGTDQASIRQDLEQLFRRVVFNVAAGNRDDHLRNHGFILTPAGWRIAPAFDVNPNIDKAEHVLNLDDRDNMPSIASVLATHSFYALDEQAANALAMNIVGVVRTWEAEARGAGIPRAEIELMRSAFV
jgi:serine/threonine-protein kinase HipA